MPDLIVIKASIEKFLTNYDIGKLVSFKHVKKGFANRVFYIKTTQGEYILKIAVRNNPNNRFKYEVDLLEHLKGRGLPVPKIIRSKKNKLFLRYQGHGAFIYEYLPGKQLEKFSSVMFREIGTTVAKIHLTTAKFESPVKRMELYNVYPALFKRQVALSRKTKDKKILGAIDYFEQELPKYFLPKFLPQGAMHIDVKPENTLFKNGHLSGLVDFDNSYNGPLVFDLAHTLMWFCARKGNFDFAKTKIVYDAYNRVRHLNKAERDNMSRALHYSCLSHSFIDVYFQIHRKELSLEYVYWGIDNLLPAHKHLLKNEARFKKIFK